MDTIRYIFWLLTFCIEILSHYWFISALLVFLACVAVVWLAYHPPIRSGIRLTAWLALLSPLGLLICGGVFRASPSVTFQLRPIFWLVCYAVFFILLAAAYLGAIMRSFGQRLAASAIVALGIWLSLCASFVFIMSVTGEWF
jgi:hypothetical protein